VVVAEDRPVEFGAHGQVAAVGAQVVPGGERGVVDVVRVLVAVAVAVGAPGGPGGGDELHGSDGAVPNPVAVEAAVVGVGNAGYVAGAVELHP
jgi:hypothetical protein